MKVNKDFLNIKQFFKSEAGKLQDMKRRIQDAVPDESLEGLEEGERTELRDGLHTFVSANPAYIMARYLQNEIPGEDRDAIVQETLVNGFDEGWVRRHATSPNSAGKEEMSFLPAHIYRDVFLQNKAEAYEEVIHTLVKNGEFGGEAAQKFVASLLMEGYREGWLAHHDLDQKMTLIKQPHPSIGTQEATLSETVQENPSKKPSPSGIGA